jgi:hypothetical protein
LGRSGLAAIARLVLAAAPFPCDTAIQYDLDLIVILKAFDEEVIQLPVVSRNDEQVPRSRQENTSSTGFAPTARD